MGTHSTSADPRRETTNKVAWPSIGATAAGKFLGRWYNFGPRVSLLGLPVRPGWLLALATIPVALFLYANKIVPRIPGVVFGFSNPWCRRYRLTTERVVVEHPFESLSRSQADRSVKESVRLGEFDSIDIEVQPGQEWYRAGDLVFLQSSKEVLRLRGIPHPEAFRKTCLQANDSRQGVNEARRRGLAV